jgi:hypothetical protein
MRFDMHVLRPTDPLVSNRSVTPLTETIRVHVPPFLLVLALTPSIAFGQVGDAAKATTPAAAPIVASPAVLPGSGLAQHPFLYAGEWDTRKPVQTMFIVRGGEVVWSYSIPSKEELGDAFLLSNGNIVFSRKVSASEVTPDKKLVWHYDAPSGCEIHTTQPIGLERVLIMQNGDPAKLMVIQKSTGRVEKELILPTRNPKNAHGQFRHVRMTKAGTFLVPHMDMGKVVEYDADGKELWSVPAPSAWAAVRLDDGNTLISGNQHGYVREVDSKGEVVWELAQKDVPDIKLYTIQEVSRLANGNTVICNWCPGFVKEKKDWPSTVQVLEVTRDKKLVWALRSWTDPADLGPASSLQLLDEPGVAEDRELKR